MKVSIAFLPRLVCTLVCEDDAHMVDVVETATSIEFWLFRRDCGTKSMMFGMSKAELERENYDFDDLIEMVEANLDGDSYLADYDNDYVDEA